MVKRSTGWCKRAEATKLRPSSSDALNAAEHGESTHEVAKEKQLSLRLPDSFHLADSRGSTEAHRPGNSHMKAIDSISWWGRGIQPSLGSNPIVSSRYTAFAAKAGS